jgi:hypothetical protein
MAIAPGATGNTPVTAGATSASVDITAAPVGAVVYCWAAISTDVTTQTGVPSNASWTVVQSAQTTAGTSGATYALYRRVKQSGDTAFSFSWTTSAKGIFAWASYSGVNTTTPDEQSTAVQLNDTTARTAVPGPSATPVASNRWALACFGVRTTTSANKPISWTPDAATTERADVDNNTAASAAWLGVEIADSNGPVTQASHSYTATHNASESHDGSVLLFLIPAATAPPLHAPVRSRITLPPRGRIAGGTGCPVRNPVPAPPQHGPVRARIPQRLAGGRVYSNPGNPVTAPAPVYPARSPVRARLPQPHPRAGWVAGSRGAPVFQQGPALYPLQGEIRAQLPQMHPRAGRVSGNPGAPVRNPTFPVPAPPLRGPVRAPVGQAWSKGRSTASPGAPVQNPAGPQSYELRKALHAQPAVLLKGRIVSSPGAPVRNATTGPRTYPLPGPVRARLPQLHPRAGRVLALAGAPVFNPVVVVGAQPVITAGDLRLRWAGHGGPGRWRELEHHGHWDTSAGDGHWREREHLPGDWTEIP